MEPNAQAGHHWPSGRRPSPSCPATACGCWGPLRCGTMPPVPGRAAGVCVAGPAAGFRPGQTAAPAAAWSAGLCRPSCSPQSLCRGHTAVGQEPAQSQPCFHQASEGGWRTPLQASVGTAAGPARNPGIHGPRSICSDARFAFRQVPSTRVGPSRAAAALQQAGGPAVQGPSALPPSGSGQRSPARRVVAAPL